MMSFRQGRIEMSTFFFLCVEISNFDCFSLGRTRPLLRKMEEEHRATSQREIRLHQGNYWQAVASHFHGKRGSSVKNYSQTWVIRIARDRRKHSYNSDFRTTQTSTFRTL